MLVVRDGMASLLKHARISRYLPALILAWGIFLTWLLCSHLQQQESAAASSELESLTRELVSGVEQRMLVTEQILRGVAGLFASRIHVERSDFRRYLEGLKLAEHRGNIQAVGYSARVAGGDKTRHIAAMRAQGFPDYEIKPAGERELYAAVTFIEPFDARNRRALGYDMLSEPIRMAAAALARDEDRPVMTDRLTLVQESGQDLQAGVIVFLPIYRQGTPLQSVEQRRSALLGWAYCAIRIGDLLRDYQQREHDDLFRQVAFQAYSGSAANPAALLHDSSPPGSPPGRFSVVRTTPMFGHHWTFRVSLPATYWNTHPAAAGSREAAVAGTALTLLVAWGAWLTSRAHTRTTAALNEATRAHRRLAEREALLRTIYDNSSVAIFLTDLNGKIAVANQHMGKMFASPLPKLIGADHCQLVPVSERDALRKRFSELIAGSTPQTVMDQPFLRSDSDQFWGQMAGSPLRDADGNVMGVLTIIEDISERREIEQALRASETRYRLLADNASDVIWTIDIQGCPTYISPSVTRLRGFSVHEAMHQTLEQWYTASSWQLAQDTIDRLLTAAYAGERSPEASIELEQRCKNGATVWTETKLSGFYDGEGLAVGILGVTRDITERRRIQDRIAHMANHDALTDLPNRLLLSDRIEQALALSRRERSRIALMMLDLDRFKPVNDSFGHAVGDSVLHEVANRVRACVRDSDTVGRIGGDEFVVMLPAVRNAEDALRVAQKIRFSLEQPIESGRRSLAVSVSIGVAIYPEHGIDGIELLQNADVAMYRAKDAGGNHVVLFSLDDRLSHPERLRRGSPQTSDRA